ncbi:MAG: ABC transporter, substrate-binding protein (cluster 4, leucine/isoleucine/valine/benzoate) [Ktedonobacterales bacterium]|jgi:branched-chain amino acid transport system substrate-binding protein|nr:MAG: ABC transporter, substrate-binding protein (cluster 4, leucine/isoleucine/valine/benzoate) [Ktedonobacterales bacterium]
MSRPKGSQLWGALCALGTCTVILATLAACGTSGGSTTSSGPIKIGFTVSLTGDFSDDGKAVEQGYQLWADTINAHGGLLGRQVSLDILDDASNPDQVTTDYQKLITVDKVDLLFGPFSTLLTKPASVVAHRYGYALPEGSGGGPSVFTAGLNNVFDVSLPVASNLVSFAQYILALPAAQRPQTAAYATEDDPFTQPQVDLAKQMLEQGGVKTAYYNVYPAETTDFAPIAQAVIHSGAQVTIFGTLLPDITAFIQAFKQQHYNPQGLIATAGPDQGTQFLNNIGGAQSAEGIFVPNGWYAELNAPGNADMVAAYVAKYGGTPDDISSDVAEAYSVGQVVQQAVTQNKSLDNAKLIQTLHSGTFTSVQGDVKFDSTGQNTAATAYLFQWQSGKLIPVFPASAATAQPEYPKPNWP